MSAFCSFLAGTRQSGNGPDEVTAETGAPNVEAPPVEIRHKSEKVWPAWSARSLPATGAANSPPALMRASVLTTTDPFSGPG